MQEMGINFNHKESFFSVIIVLMATKISDLSLENIKIDPSNLTISETLDMVSSYHEGISSEEAKSRLVKYGKNELPEKEKESKLKIFLKNFKSPLVYALFAAAALAVVLGKYVDTTVILFVIFVNAIIGYIQETKAKKDIDALKKLSAFFVKVVREGRVSEINSSLLVPGDVVVLDEGLRIPADGRIIEGNSLLLNESSLTGESETILKTDEKISNKDQITSKNMVYQGTVVAEGNGRFVVLSTGQDTKFGKVALFAQEAQTETPIQRKIEKLSKQIGVTVLLVSFLVFLIGIFSGHGAVDMVQLSVSLAVSAIPEGLPIAVTVILVLGAKRMAKRNAIVRNMMAVETLGTTTVIATDKTGTLTHNKLKITDIYTQKKYHFEQGKEHGSYFSGKNKYFGDDIKNLLTAGAVCNDAELDRDKGIVIGEPTDAAILENASMFGIKKRSYPRLDEVPFTSQKRFMAILTQVGRQKVVFIKGAPEEILKKCSHFLDDKTAVSKLHKQEILKQIEKMSRDGLRVVAVAEKKCQDHFSASLNSGFTFLGLIGMKDTYRPGVKEDIRKCKEAGIKIVMLTGDHMDTASTIAKKLGIINDNKQVVLAQSYFSSDKASRKDIGEIAVFSRILPELKYKVINLLKKKGEVVAMTGDGVNDVPALRKADIGVAMGVSGTDAAKEAADIVLADDNFSTIVSAVEEGRTIFANLRKTLLYLISTSAGEVMAVLGSLILSLPLPITPLQILWINLITDTSATIPLGVEPKEKDHLKVPPRNPKEGIISALMVRRSLMVGIYMGVVALIIFKTRLSQGIEYARTVTFLFLTISQWVNAFNCRSEKRSVFGMNFFSNPTLLLGIFLGILLQLGVMYIFVFREIFHFVPVGINEWIFAIVASLGLILLIEADKLVSSFFKRGK